MWIVRLTDQPGAYGPFDDPTEATRFRDFLTNEVGPAEAAQLWSPLDALLNWRDAQAARPSVRGGARLNPGDEDGYREEQGT